MLKYYVAIDLGAESGRVMLGRIASGRLVLDLVRRWPSRRVKTLGGERWDLLFMWDEILQGLRDIARRGSNFESISIDAWGVDYAYVARDEALLAPPFMYRDPRTAPIYERLSDDDRDAIFGATGVQFMPINTLYQLQADGGRLASAADSFLLIADYFAYLLTGRIKQERSLASTTQLYDPRRRTWSDRLIDRFGLDRRLFPDLIDAGETIGTISADVAEATGLPSHLPVVATCGHDTGNAVAATPLSPGAAYLSSGTWSLLGVEVAEPVINDTTRRHNFTNEVGFGHSIRLLKNLSGLFLVQECRAEFDGPPSYEELASLAGQAEAGRSLIRPDAAPFALPGNMCGKIADYCRQTNQPVPESPGQFVRCCYESLALLYNEALAALAEVTGHRPTSLNIVGGGSQSDLLNQLAADACGLPVEAGPVEATALGNIGLQAIAAGQFADLADLREAVRASVQTRRYTPNGPLASHAGRFASLPTSLPT